MTMAEQSRPPRLSNQMERTRTAIVAAARDLADSGAEITMPVQDAFYGERRYEATDPEGHRWHFAQRLRPGLTTEHS